MIKVGSVIQANENAGPWAGCLMFVDEVKSWGVQAGMVIPYQGVTYIRLSSEQYEYVGEAILMPADDETV